MDSATEVASQVFFVFLWKKSYTPSMNNTIYRYHCLLEQAVYGLKRIGLVLLLLTVMALGLGALPSSAETLPASIRVEQLAAHRSSGSAPIVVLWVEVAEGYHVYAHDETAGRPLHATVETVPSSEQQPTILYPQGIRKADPLNPGQVVRVLENRFPLFVCPAPIGNDVWPYQLDIRLSMLLCSTSRCVPWDEPLQVVLDAPATLPDIALFPDIAKALAKALPSADTIKTEFPAPTQADTPSGLARLGLSKQKQTQNGDADSGQRLQTASPASFSFSPRSFQQGFEPGDLGPALVFGLLAGIILNVMPCVLPVLTIKITGLLALGSSASLEVRKRRLRRYTSSFAAGILAWFACLAVLMRVAGLAWGGLFQIDSLVFGLMVLVFLLALSLFDVFVLPVPGVRLGQKREDASALEAFLFGMTVTLLATPCSGPLLGGVLAWSALQTPWVQWIVIMAAGVGMAMPYLLMSLWPGIATRLPRPGVWMKDMERLAGFFLMGTVLYLLSILPEWQWFAALITLLVAAICAWMWGRWAGLSAPGLRRAILTAVCVICLIATSWWALTPPKSPEVVWQPFSKELFFQQLGKETMLVEFTADWCPTCKVLEKTVLGSEALQTLAERYHLRLIRVDLTQADPDSEAFLRSLDSVSIPLLALFPAGEKAQEPLLLRDLFTLDDIESLVKLASNKG